MLASFRSWVSRGGICRSSEWLNPEKDSPFFLSFLLVGQPWFLVVPRECETVEAAEDPPSLRFTWTSSVFPESQGKQAWHPGSVNV